MTDDLRVEFLEAAKEAGEALGKLREVATGFARQAEVVAARLDALTEILAEVSAVGLETASSTDLET